MDKEIGNQKMKKGKISAAALILGIFLISGLVLPRVPAPKDLSRYSSTDMRANLLIKRADINGIAYRLYQMLMTAGKRMGPEPARRINIKSIFSIMNL